MCSIRRMSNLLLLVFDHIIPVLQNIKLVDQLASDAADAERQRIALNFHDRVIQPYLGLHMALEAIRQNSQWALLTSRTTSTGCWTLTEDELAQLRHLVQGLKSGGERVGSLVPAIRRFSRKFTACYRHPGAGRGPWRTTRQRSPGRRGLLYCR